VTNFDSQRAELIFEFAELLVGTVKPHDTRTMAFMRSEQIFEPLILSPREQAGISQAKESRV
jgi:hypothetical protein